MESDGGDFNRVWFPIQKFACNRTQRKRYTQESRVDRAAGGAIGAFRLIQEECPSKTTKNLLRRVIPESSCGYPEVITIETLAREEIQSPYSLYEYRQQNELQTTK